MSEARFTPGPWTFARDENDWSGARVITAPGADLPLMCDTMYYPWCPDEDADWHLISAAPELYEALKTLVVMLPSDAPERDEKERIPAGFCYIRWQDLREARAALRKATGESA